MKEYLISYSVGWPNGIAIYNKIINATSKKHALSEIAKYFNETCKGYNPAVINIIELC